jgi:hypothetical protein
MALAASAGWPASSAMAQPAALSCPADPRLAKLLAASDVVLIGRMTVPQQRLREEARKPTPKYVEIPIHVEGLVKGDAGTGALRVYPQDRAYAPSNKDVVSLAGKPAILFLTRVDQGPVGLYFAGHSPDALKPATDANIIATRTEAQRQAKIISLWRPETRLPHFRQVRALIASLGQVSGKEQQRVFDRLEALGEEAVPAMIAHMDDRRPLRTRAISLSNRSPGAFEGIRHYGPEQVVDGVTALLNQLTGESFGTIMNGGSARARDAAVAGWRVYASGLRCPRK